MNDRNHKTSMPRRSALAIALTLGLGISGFAHAQATTGVIFGSVPTAAGETVTVSSNSGISRTVSVDDQGRYTIGHLPLGTYTVTLKKHGNVIGTHQNIDIQVGAGVQVNFSGTDKNVQNLGVVRVSANTTPAIDVTSVSSSTVISAPQLEKLPIGHSAEAIALLAPGTVAGSSNFANNAISFGGAGVSENAYYINGYNTTEPYRYTGGFQLPYGSISQQQVYTGGYSAKYGRSDGGVINQVGKRGTNQWHLGGKISWAPRSMSSGGDNVYYPEQQIPDGYKIVDPGKPGTLHHYRSYNKQWQTIYSAYVGGPLVKDKLFAFFSVETTKTHKQQISADNVSPVTDARFSQHTTRTYGKIDWNINENNLLEITSLTSNTTGSVGGQGSAQGKGSAYAFDYDTLKTGKFLFPTDAQVNDARFLIAKYTSYISDNATLEVTWGRGKFKNNWEYGINSKLPAIGSPGRQRGNAGITNTQPRYYNFLPDASNSTRGLRADFTYQLGDHKLGIGIDNMTYAAHDQGQTMSGPGYAWLYNSQSDPTKPIKPGLGVGAPGGDGYYVAKYKYIVATSMSMDQEAYYIQDVWHISHRFQLNLGLRNDHFTNYNNEGIAFVDEKNQWEPRIGFSWDVNGDSTLKIYGNAGRYYLALPNNVAERAANPSIFTKQFFTYSGIDENGIPQNLKPVGGVNGAPPPGPVSADNEYGQPKDPRTVTANDLEAQYQDEFILGFDEMLGRHWVYGAKATYRILRTAIDDVCASSQLKAKLITMGLDADQYKWADPGCRIFNPGSTNHFYVARKDGSGYVNVAMSAADWGFKQGAKRKYYGLDLYLSHPFDGKWMARVDYVFSRSWGNSEGQVRSDIGQVDISKTTAWDAWQLMDHSYGYLANHRRHQIKARGAYQITPEWLVSTTLRIQSGTPISCLGYFGPGDTNPIGYRSGYHWCGGKPSNPGDAGFTPWTHRWNLAIRYTPAFADHKLAFKLAVFNVLDEQKPIQVFSRYEAGQGAIRNTYGMGQYFERPRYARLSISYDY